MNSVPNSATEIPVCELHRHLDGAFRLQTLLELADRHGIELPGKSVDSLRPHVQVLDPEDGLMAFIAKFRWLTAVLADTDACRRIARENVLDAAAEGIDYVELRFSPWFMAATHGLDPQAVTEAVADGVRSGEADTGVRAPLIGILSRTYGVETAHRELDALLACRDDLIAIDLAGDEQGFPARLFRTHFERVRDAGLRVTVHAGEADGPRSVREAIEDLGAERIGHGVRSIEDPEVVDLLVTRGIGLEVCLTSNVHTGVVPGYDRHPAQRLMERGVQLCLNTDDPGISGIDLPHEFEVAAPAAGLSEPQIREARRNALEMAFLSPDEIVRASAARRERS